MINETHKVPDGIHGVRLSDYARTAFPSIPSRKAAAKTIKFGEMRIDGETAHSGDWVNSGQLLEWMESQRAIPKIYRLPLDIIFEDEHLAIVNKPPGIEVSGNKFKTIQNALPGNLAPSTKSDALRWPHPVHRLDYSTSGLLLVAKTAAAQVFLGNQFSERNVHKRYRAVVMGKLNSAGQVDEPINEMSAQSEYKPVEMVSSLRSEQLSLVDLFPLTGRTHQLRIHMAAIGHPIVGDQKYGKEGNVLKGKGLFLAAVELRFLHPATRREQVVSIETPPKFSSLLKREQARWEKFNTPSSKS